MDPFTLVALASGAFKLIKDSCEMYKEGRQLVVDAAKEIDGIVKDVKSVQKKASGVFGFLTQIFGKKEEVAPVQAVVQPKKKVKQKAPEFDENLIYQQVSDALIKFFQAYNGLKHYKEDKEAEALTVGGDEGNEIAIQLVIADLQMEKLNTELSDYMVYHVPAELKDLYTRVNRKIGQIANMQALAKREEQLAIKRAKWLRRQKLDKIQNRLLTMGLTTILMVWAWITMMVMTGKLSTF